MSTALDRLGTTKPVLGDDPDVPRDLGRIADKVESKGVFYGQGLLSARPAASTTLVGTVYYATDSGHLFYCTGSAWVDIGPAAIADGSVTVLKLADHSVTSVKIADLAVGTAQLADSSVTTNKLAPNSVGYNQIADALKPSQGAASTDETLRALGTASGQALPGNHASVTNARAAADASVGPTQLVTSLAQLLGVPDIGGTHPRRDVSYQSLEYATTSTSPVLGQGPMVTVECASAETIIVWWWQLEMVTMTSGEFAGVWAALDGAVPGYVSGQQAGSLLIDIPGTTYVGRFGGGSGPVEQGKPLLWHPGSSGNHTIELAYNQGGPSGLGAKFRNRKLWALALDFV